LLDLDPMISKTPSGPPRRQQPDTSEAALQWAANAMQSGRAAEAERAAGEVLQKNPGDARAAHIYGHALYQQGRGQDAIAPLERAIQQNHSPVLETQVGMLLRQADRLDDALKYLARATKRQPPFPPAFLEYGSLLLEQLRYDEAVEVLERGLYLAPNFAEILAHLGTAYAARGERDKASQAFARVLATAPNEPDTMFSLACLMKNSCCFKEAAALFKRLLEIDPNDSSARINLGVCLIEIGENDAGFAELGDVTNANPKIFGQALNAVASTGRGRFWLRRSAAESYLKRKP
jgi:tetratricopeptide (TPR) repeat protein